MAKLFKEEPLVAFGDINLQENNIREVNGVAQDPGSGGWPTIRYFSNETGYGGASYPKRWKDMQMCEELGAAYRMQDYVQDVSPLLLCNPSTENGCSKKEVKFIAEWKDRSAELVAEATRLQEKKVKDKDKQRKNRNRAKLLLKMASSVASPGAEKSEL